MPEYVSENGRRMGAPADSPLERQLLKKGWQPVESDETAPAAEDDPHADLKGLKRDELNAIAEELGVENVADIPNAGAVAEAIRTAREEANDG
jgi:hypothetical protein